MRVMSVIAPRHEFCRIARLVYFDEADTASTRRQA